MKPFQNPFVRSAALGLTAFLAFPVATQTANAATRTKANNADDLNLTTSWGGGIVPGSGDVASWDSTVSGTNSVLLGGNLGWAGIQLTNPGGAVTIGAGNTLTLGTSGIDMGSATQDLTISSGLTLGSGGQTWNVASGRTLTLNTGTFTRSTGATLLIDKTTNTGTVSAANITNANAIVGPWAILKSSGTAANNSANGYTFATKDLSGNLVAYTGATAVTTGFPASSAATNYDVSATGTQAQIGSSRAMNTIRFTGTAAYTQQTNSTQTQTINGIMNAGGGLFTLGGGTQTMNLQSGSGELVLAAMTNGITINGPIINNGATAGAVTVMGGSGQTVTLAGNSTFTGNLVINSGTLAAGTGQGAAPTASNLGALQPAANRNITVNNGGTLSLTGGNVLGTGGSTNTLSNTTLVVNAGGVFQTGLNGSGTGWWNKIGATTLNAGTIHVGSGANTGAFQGLALIGTVTVTGSSASTIDNFGASNTASNGIHLGQNATASQSITFDVADVTGSSASDLNISAKLLNTSSTLTASGLTKTGAGTLTLSATNAYTGATTISNGTLQIGNGTTDGSISTSSGITNNAALVYNLVGSQSFSNGIGGSGTLTKTGAGTFTLSGTNNYAGATTVNAGTLAMNGTLTSNIGVNSGGTITGTGSTTGSLTLNAGSTFSGNTSGIFTANGVIFTGATNLIFNGATTNGATYDLFNYGAGGVSGLGNLTSTFRATLFDDTANTKVTATVSTGSRTWNTTDGTWESGGASSNWQQGDLKFFNGDTVTFGNPASSSTVTLSGTLLPAGSVSVNNTNAYTFSGSGSIGGTASLAKSGSGDLTISSTNSYSGGTTLDAGTLNANSAAALGTGAITVNGGTLNANAASAFGTAALTVNGGTLNVNNATGLGTGTVTLAGGSLDNMSGGSITSSTNNAQNWNGDFAFTGSSDLNMGTGNVTIGGAGTRTVTVNAGTLSVGKISSTSQGFTKDGAGTLAITTAAASSIGGTLNVANGTLQINTGSTTGTTSDLTATGLAGSGTITNGGGVERWLIVTNATSNSFAGTLANGAAGALGFSKQGAGTMTLDGANSYTGTTTVGGGSLVINGANSGAGTNVTLGANTLVLGNASALGSASTINASNGATLRIATDGGDTAYSTNFGTGTTLNVILDRATAGAGVNHALGAATYGGGTVNFTSGANVTSGTASVSYTSLSLTAGSTQTTLLNPNNTRVSIGSVTIGLNNQAKTLGLGGTSTGNEVTGNITNGVGTVSVTKSNTSTWTLSGTSSYTGATLVSAGTLLVNGALGNTTTTVSGGTLGGSGTIAGATTIQAGGTLSAGNSPGLLSFGSTLTLEGNTLFEIGGLTRVSEYDGINTGGLLTYGGALNIVSYDLGSGLWDLTQAAAYDLFGISGGQAGDFATVTVGGNVLTLASGIWSGVDSGNSNVTYTFDQATGDLTVAIVPEPGAALLGALGLIILLRRKRS